MIVCCPSCQTRYHYHEPVAGAGNRAICDRCQALVPLVAYRPAYVLSAQVTTVPAGIARGARSSIGMDDPTLAGRVGGGARGSGLDGGEAAMTYRVMAREVVAEQALADPETAAAEPLPDAMPMPEPFPDLPGDAGLGDSFGEVFGEPEGLGFERPLQPVHAEDAASTEEKAALGEAPPAPGRGRRLLQLAVLLLVAAGGAAGAHYAMMYGWVGPLRVHPEVGPIHPVPLGALLGVVLAWAGIRWTSRRS